MDTNQYNNIANTESHTLNENQIRVLGTLCEKQLNKSKSYPLTVNDTRLACNQKSGRQPQMTLTNAEVSEAARVLASRGLITIDRSSRTERYAHKLDSKLKLDRATLAVLTVQMLRGPLSVALIRSATRRLHPFDTNQAILEILQASSVFAIAPRKPVQRGHRYMQNIDAVLAEQSPAPEATRIDSIQRMQKVERDLNQLHTLLEPGLIARKDDQRTKQ